MKVRIISLFLSVAFLSILTFEYVSNTMLVENSANESVEYVLEKRLADKFMDDSYILSSYVNDLGIEVKAPHTFAKVFYTFQINNTLFRPPITL